MSITFDIFVRDSSFNINLSVNLVCGAAVAVFVDDAGGAAEIVLVGDAAAVVEAAIVTYGDWAAAVVVTGR